MRSGRPLSRFFTLGPIPCRGLEERETLTLRRFAARGSVNPVFAVVLWWVLLGLPAAARQEPFRQWPLERALQVLNDSPWARQETFTRVISGVGSGASGEKEIFNTFYVRFLSARPVREALVRVQQIEYGYDGLPPEDRGRFDRYAEEDLLADFEDWIVVAVAFRSNDPNQESDVRRFFERQTGETLKNRAFLSTRLFSQVRIADYFPPRDEGIGAKFVFPRRLEGAPVVNEACDAITFELLDVPGASPRLRARFRVKAMVVGGRLIL